MAAPLLPVANRLRRRYGVPAPAAPAFDPYPGFTAQPPPPTPEQFWRDMISADSGYQQDLADILAASNIDKGSIEAALRQALIRFGGAPALRDTIAKLGSQPGWENLLDNVTIGAAEAADRSGTSLMAQLDKAHQQRMLADADVRAAKGLTQSGQTGFEIGEERQRDTIARNDAVNQLLDFISGNIGAYAGREAQRNRDRSGALQEAGQRVRESGMEPPAPPRPPATPPALMAQLRRNARRPPRRPIGGWE